MTTETQQQAQAELHRRKKMRDQVEQVAKPEEKHAEIKALIEETNKELAKPEALARLRQYLSTHRDELDLIGNLTGQVEGTLITTNLRHSALLVTATEEYCYQMRNDLGHKTAPPLEKALIEHLVICWLRMHITELQYEQHTKGVTLPVATFWENTLSATQKRYLRAAETLARIRKLGISVQINIGDKQVINQV